MAKKLHVAVLMGGWNSEREVSLRSGEAVYQALLSLGYQASKIDFNRNIVDELKKLQPDVVFNALHGRFGEDGKIQGLLDILNIPYTHSGIAASVIGMDKILTQKICNNIGVKYPKHEMLIKGQDAENRRKIVEVIKKPFVIKPISEGSSVGVEVVLADSEFDFAKYEWRYGDVVIIERYIAGQELNVAVVNDEALGVLEVRPKKLFYDYFIAYSMIVVPYKNFIKKFYRLYA